MNPFNDRMKKDKYFLLFGENSIFISLKGAPSSYRGRGQTKQKDALSMIVHKKTYHLSIYRLIQNNSETSIRYYMCLMNVFWQVRQRIPLYFVKSPQIRSLFFYSENNMIRQ